MSDSPRNYYEPGGKRVSEYPAYPLDKVKYYWDDVRVPGTQIHQGGERTPVWAKFADDGEGSYGVYTWHFEEGERDDLLFSVQLPHTYREGTDIYPHVHYATTSGSGGNILWALEYTWANVGDVFPANSSTVSTLTDESSTVPYTQRIASFGALDGTDKRISSMLVCRIIRNGSHGSDTHDGDVAFLEVDFHFEVDSPGSIRPLNKVGDRSRTGRFRL